MAIQKPYSTIKSAGVYRYVYDKSQVPETERETLRLMMGYSEKGPFNTPVYIDDANEFIKTFGNINRRMERKGVFFNRLCLQALDEGPILVLNMKPFNADPSNPEEAGIYAFNASDIGPLKVVEDVTTGDDPATETTYDMTQQSTPHPTYLAQVASTKKGTRNQGITSIYDTNRFWKVDENRLHDISMPGATAATGLNDYIRLVHTSDNVESNTVFIRPYVPTVGWHVKVSDWYSAQTDSEIPAWADSIKDHFLDEYFAEIYVFRGDLKKPALYSSDGTLGSTIPCEFIYEYDDNGLVTYWNEYTTESTDSSGNPNTPVYTTEEYHRNEDDTGDVKNADAKDSDGKQLYQDKDGNITTESSTGDEENTKLYQLTDDDGNALYINPQPENPKMLAIRFYDENGYQKVWSSCAETDEQVQSDYPNTYVGNWQTDFMKWSDDELIAEPTETDEIKMSWQPFCKVIEETETTTDGDGNTTTTKTGNTYLVTNNNYHSNYGPLDDALEAMSDVDTSNYLGSYNGILFPSFKSGEGSFISLDTVFNQDYQTHKMLMQMNESLLDEAADLDSNYSGVYGDGDVDSEGEEVEGMDEHTKDPEVTKESGETPEYKSPASFVHALCSCVCHLTDPANSGDEFDQYTTEDYDPAGFACYGIFMRGYIYNSISRADRGLQLVNKILGVLSYKGIREALTNNVDADYHYIIDTLQTYPGFAMKSAIAGVAKEKDNCLAILNFPNIDEVMKYCGVSKYDGGFDMSLITKGSSGISLPTESQGASWITFYTQLKMTDGGTKFDIPSAALVSNLYMVKRAKRLPYYIVAGPNYGQIKYNGLVGPDYNYARADLDILEPFGVNAITYMPQYGTCINGNQTAKQTPKTALSKAHIRELVIFIQDEVEKTLRSYQWELNTATLRDNVAAKCRTICSLVQANGGIYAYNVVCDSTNNTPEMIDNEFLVVDIEIEPSRGTEKCVQTLTLRRTGEMTSTETV